MNDVRKCMEAELVDLSVEERRLAMAFGSSEEFQDTYGLDAYRGQKLLRSLAVPAGVERAEVAAYLQLAFNATYLRDRFRCAYCDLDGLATSGSYARIQIDHLVPIEPADVSVWAGVPDDLRFVRANGPANLTCACNRCNPLKNNQLLGTALTMTRAQKVEAVRRQLGRAGHPDPYDAELLAVRAFMVGRGEIAARNNAG